MKNFISKYGLSIILFLLPLVVNAVFIIAVNKQLNGGFVNILDSGLLLTPVEVNKKAFTLWTENNFGFVNSLFAGLGLFSYIYSYVLIEFLKLSTKNMELILYFIFFNGIFYCAWHAFYLIQKKLFNTKNVFYPFLIAIFYSYNFLIISLLGVIDGLFLLLISYPYLLYVLIKTVDEKEINIKYVFYFSLFLILTINNPQFSLAVYITFFIPYIFFKKNLFSLKNLCCLLLTMFLVLLISSPFIFSLIHAYTTGDPYAYESTAPVNVGYIDPPYGVLGLFQFFFHWPINLFDTPSNLYFKSVFGLVSSYLLWLVTLYMFIKKWKWIKNKRIFAYLFVSLILSIFLYKGRLNPFGEINIFIYQALPILNMFRTPGTKFALPILLVLSVLILNALNNRKIIITVIFASMIIMHTWVFFNPANIVSVQMKGFNQMIVKISPEYQDAISFINTQKDGAIMFLPGLSTANYDFKNGQKFFGKDVFGKYIKRSIIYPDDSMKLYLSKQIVEKILKDFDQKTIGNTGIRFILIRKDFDINLMDQRVEVNKRLKILKDNHFKQIYNSELFTMFQISDQYYRDIITIKSANNEYAPKYTKLSPYHYRLEIKSNDLINKKLIFRNSYFPDWKILGLEEKGLKAEHFLAYNFANGWRIKLLDEKAQLNLDQQIKLEIYFYPQKIFTQLCFLAIISLFICVGSIAIFKFNKRSRASIKQELDT